MSKGPYNVYSSAGASKYGYSGQPKELSESLYKNPKKLPNVTDSTTYNNKQALVNGDESLTEKQRRERIAKNINDKASQSATVNTKLITKGFKKGYFPAEKLFHERSVLTSNTLENQMLKTALGRLRLMTHNDIGKDSSFLLNKYFQENYFF